MTIVLAAATDASARDVCGVAEAVADVVHARVRRVNTDLLAQPTSAAVLTELQRPDTTLGVIERGRNLADVGASWRIARRAAKPVVIVPAGFHPESAVVISRVLLPLDGTPESTSAVRDTMALFADAGVELVVLHVFDEATTPRFWDQAAHARDGWEHEFRARCCAPPHARIELRRGVPGERVVAVAAAEHPDLIALGWHQHLEAGRARTVRATVRDAAIPVMLVPVATAVMTGDFRPAGP